MAASVEFEFSGACVAFQDTVKQAAGNSDASQCFSFVEAYSGNDQEKKAALDQAMREVLRSMIVFDQGCEEYKKLIGMAVDAVTKELCSASTPFLMLADVFDMMVLDDCQDMFDFVEDRVLTWKSEPFFDAGKNYLLRMCNDLIRRLSKSQNTVFCGRIQLFLSRLFPLSEKSALNLMSQFNLENITVFASQSSDAKASESAIKQEKMEVEDGGKDASALLIDYNLYRKFWSLQDYFRKPVQCYDKAAWRAFAMYSDEVLNAFMSCKLDDMLSQRKILARRDDHTTNFFAKYLTSEKLLDLQLSDSNFRRYVLVQFLILFQYLTSTVRFKGATQVLSEEQTNWVKASEEKVYQLIRETPPAGDKFADIVKHVLQREEHWNNWKNEGCPSYERAKAKDAPKPKSRPKRRRIGEDLQGGGGKIIKMGSAELTRLWNLNPDNMEACRSEKREFTPTLEEFFANAIEQNDPEAMVEDQYKDIHTQNFQWKALRLLAQRSPHFFLNTHQPAIPLPKYLDTMISKIAKEMPANGNEEMKTQVGEEEEDDMKETQDETETVEEQEQNKEDVNEEITEEQMKAVAELLGDNWKKLASELRFSGEDIADFEALGTGESAAAKMIFLWQDSDPENTAPVLRDALKEIGQLAIAESVFGPSS
ncbi:THO complex subunit 1-like [Littorina saxatilis]|uniref:Death domain-containing protein n=1 Tax=Littorina saxatilis TaxID=31220 RepID=A0AAN9B8E2_9CAEN